MREQYTFAENLAAPGGGSLYFDDCVGILPFLIGPRSPLLETSLRLNDATVLAAAFAAAAVAALVSLEACPKAVEGRVFIKLAKFVPLSFFPNADIDEDGFFPTNANFLGVTSLCFPEPVSATAWMPVVGLRTVACKFLSDGFLSPDGAFVSSRATFKTQI